jgi:hypothetical protein
MRPTISIIVKLPQMHNLLDCSGIALEIPDQFLVMAALWSAEKTLERDEASRPPRPRLPICLFDHLVGSHQQCREHLQAHRVSGLEVDH